MPKKNLSQAGTSSAVGDIEVTTASLTDCAQKSSTWADGEFAGPCPVRDVFDRIGDKWSILVMLQLGVRPQRFRELLREVGGVSQRMLTVTLRALERDGLVHREVIPSRPPSVSYCLSTLGVSLLVSIRAVAAWASENGEAMRQARSEFESKSVDLTKTGQTIHLIR